MTHEALAKALGSRVTSVVGQSGGFEIVVAGALGAGLVVL